jgi:uncharacterized protein YbbC (DUF1343 family)
MPHSYIAPGLWHDKCDWNPGCTQINTDKNEGGWNALVRNFGPDMNISSDRAKNLLRAFIIQSLVLLFVLSVLTCVPLRSQTPAPAASQAAPAAHTLTGIDVLESESFAPLVGKRVGLITNQTGLDHQGRSTIDLLAHAPGVKLVALFSPEHGIRGAVDERVASSKDEATGLPIYSLYGETLRPTDEMLAGLNALVFDIQDAGVRFYTYITTLGYVMEAAAAHHIPLYILDRPDPLGGERIEGPMLDRDRTNFVGYFPMPVRMGMTLGEMAKMFNVQKVIKCDLHVIRLQNWQRRFLFDDTGLLWVNPSPNLRSPAAGILYPGLEILQAGGVSVGRGTEHPFELVGAPWIHGDEFSVYLNHRAIPGVRFEAAKFTPDTGLYKGEPCEGVKVVLTDRAALQSMLMGLEIASALKKIYPGKFDSAKMIELVGNAATIQQLVEGKDPAAIAASWTKDLQAFRLLRAKYLIYQ